MLENSQSSEKHSYIDPTPKPIPANMRPFVGYITRNKEICMKKLNYDESTYSQWEVRRKA